MDMDMVLLCFDNAVKDYHRMQKEDKAIWENGSV
jgi:hypothetical protein